MQFLSSLAESRKAWMLLAITALGLELAALYFQYAMGMAPCVMCIYQRNAVWGLFIAGVVGSIAPKNTIVRLLAFITWGFSGVWGSIIAWQHIEMQQNTNPFSMFTCEFVPNFPDFMPLHKWIPALFEASGDCGDINWQFMGQSMPQWMLYLLGAYSAALALVLISRLIDKRML